MSLTGRHAVVTGAGSGIGRATAERLAEAGCQVTLIGRHVARLTETADRIGDLAFAAPADVTDPDMLAAAIEAGRDRFGPIDILINNAGAAASAPFLKTDADAFRAMLALNLEAPAEAARLVLPGMLTRRWGRIVNVASTAGLKGYAYVSAYVAAKHGLVGLTRALASPSTPSAPVSPRPNWSRNPSTPSSPRPDELRKRRAPPWPRQIRKAD